jgi:hypothetical protein
VGQLVDADRCSLFLVERRQRLDGGEDLSLVSKLFDVSAQSTVQDCEVEIRVPWGTGIAGHVALTGLPLNIPDAYQAGSTCFVDEV